MADLDGDGHVDLYSGSFGGVIYVLHGEGEGVFRSPETLVDLTGDPVYLGEYYDKESKEFLSRPGSKMPTAQMLTASAVDWDADGDLDLVVGEVDGRILLIENDGTATEPEYVPKAKRIKAGRKSLWVKSGHSMPIASDWDGDGLFDILSGANDGSVTFWRNVGKSGEPAFAAPVTLIEGDDNAEPMSLMSPRRPLSRTQPHVADLDGDGQPELLVGELRRLKGEDGETQWHGLVWVYHSL